MLGDVFQGDLTEALDFAASSATRPRSALRCSMGSIPSARNSRASAARFLAAWSEKHAPVKAHLARTTVEHVAEDPRASAGVADLQIQSGAVGVKPGPLQQLHSSKFQLSRGCAIFIPDYPQTEVRKVEGFRTDLKTPDSTHKRSRGAPTCAF